MQQAETIRAITVEPSAKAERTRAAILAAAEQEFARRGFVATRLEDVASAVDLKRAALFYHFRDKQSLYDAVVADAFGSLAERLEEAFSASNPIPVRIERAVEAWVDTVVARPTLARLILRHAAEADEHASQAIFPGTDHFVRLAWSLFEQGRKNGDFKPALDDPFHAASTVIGATVFYVAVKLAFSTGSTRCRRFGAEVAVSGCYRMLEHFVPGARPHFVAFEYPAPPYRSEYARVFEGTERFEQPFTGLVIDRALVEVIQGSRDEELHTLLRVQTAKRLAQLEKGTSHADKVHEFVTATDGRANDMSSVARGLGIEPRSLRRRLAEEAVTFRPVVNRALAAIAVRLLVDERKSVQEASYEMSFSDVSSFSRAFKRWTGSTPGEYRAAHARKLSRAERIPARSHCNGYTTTSQRFTVIPAT